jgi:TusA-related sulfurtransferase
MHTFDLRLSLIPFSLLRISNVFRKMEPGEELEIIAGVSQIDKATSEDVKRILNRNSYDIVSNQTTEGNDPVVIMRLRKKMLTLTSKEKESHHV